MGVHEQRLISSVLRTRDLRPALYKGIEPVHFLDYRNEWKWVIDRNRVNKRVPSKADFRSTFPGFKILATDDVELHSGRVIESYAKALVVSGMGDILTALDEGKPIEQLVSKLRQTTRSVASTYGTQGTTSGRLTDFSSLWKEARRRQLLSETNGSIGIPYGMPTLDEATGGMMDGQLIIFASRPGVGKSWLLDQLAKEAVLAGKTALLFTLEMDAFSVQSRMVSLLSSSYTKGPFDPSAIRQGRLGRTGIVDLRKFLQNLKVPGELHIVDGSKGKLDQVALEAAIETFQPDVVFLDYLQLWARLNSGQGSDMRLEVARWSSTFKQIGEANKFPFVTASQLNRSGDSKAVPPTLGALAESDSPGQDADVIVTMVPPSLSTLRCVIAKNREGPDGRHFWIHKAPQLGLIEEVTAEQASEIATNEVFD